MRFMLDSPKRLTAYKESVNPALANIVRGERCSLWSRGNNGENEIHPAVRV